MLRVRVELIPRGNFSQTEIIDECYIANDGSIPAHGPNEGGTGNYDFALTTNLHGELRDRIGRVEGVLRTKTHRLELARRAIGFLIRPQKPGAPRRVGM